MVDLNSPHPYLHTCQFSTRVYLKSKKFTTSFNPLQLQPQSISRNFKPTPQSLPTLKRTFGRVDVVFRGPPAADGILLMSFDGWLARLT